MEQRRFKNRLEQAEWVAAQRGWGPMTPEEKADLDDAVRMVTNLKEEKADAVLN